MYGGESEYNFENPFKNLNCTFTSDGRSKRSSLTSLFLVNFWIYFCIFVFFYILIYTDMSLDSSRTLYFRTLEVRQAFHCRCHESGSDYVNVIESNFYSVHHLSPEHSLHCNILWSFFRGTDWYVLSFTLDTLGFECFYNNLELCVLDPRWSVPQRWLFIHWIILFWFTSSCHDVFQILK